METNRLYNLFSRAPRRVVFVKSASHGCDIASPLLCVDVTGVM